MDCVGGCSNYQPFPDCQSQIIGNLLSTNWEVHSHQGPTTFCLTNDQPSRSDCLNLYEHNYQIIIVGKENQSFINTLHTSIMYNGSILKFNSILISKFTRLVLLVLMTETWNKSVLSCPRRYTNYFIADWGMFNDWLNTLWLLGWMTCCKWLCTEVEEVEKGRWLQFVIHRPQRLTGQLGGRTQSLVIGLRHRLHIKGLMRKLREI